MECKECCREISEEDSKKYKGYCKSCYREKYNSNNDDIKDTNPLVDKLNIIVKLLHIIGYILFIIIGIILFINEEFLYGFIIIIGGIILTLLSTIFLEVSAEIIQLLEDIKNK